MTESSLFVHDTFFSVTPAKPLAGYIGGKRNLAQRLCKLIESVDHDGYAEPFVGMGGVFLRREKRPRVEVINDISGDVAGLFRILQRHYVPFLDMLRYQLTTRREFERMMRVDPETCTDLERAARFLYLQRLSFGGKVAGRVFGVDKTSPSRFDLTKLVPMLEAVHERLAGVVIERLPWKDFIVRYDRPGMLFFMDPPYWGNEKDYGAGTFSREAFGEMAALLAGIEGRFILTLNDVPAVREIFAGFHIMTAPTTYSLARGAARPVTELVIANVEGLTL